jgi:hypothetical protein
LEVDGLIYQNYIDLSQATVQMLGVVTNAQGEPVMGSSSLRQSTAQTCDISSYQNLAKLQDSLIDSMSTIVLQQAINIFLDSTSGLTDAYTAKYRIDSYQYSNIWANCVDELNSLIPAQDVTSLTLTTLCEADDIDPSDPCCSDSAAWSTVCLPRLATIFHTEYPVKNYIIPMVTFVIYSIDSATIKSACQSAACSNSFFNDYASQASATTCLSPSIAGIQWAMDKKQDWNDCMQKYHGSYKAFDGSTYQGPTCYSDSTSKL